MSTIFGIKKGMTQIFDEKGRPVPVTLVLAENLEVVQIKSKEKDGYEALQVGFGKAKKVTKPISGHLKGKAFRYLREISKSEEEIALGAQISIDVFKAGDKVKVIGTSKGHGFAGTIKRHHFHRAPVSHGHPFSRKPGSIGSMYPQRVMKGMRMSGRMGGKRISVKSLTVFSVDPVKNLLMIKGAVPGANNSLVEITNG